MHYSKQRLVESIPGTKVVWLVLEESNLSFTKNVGEWNGTKLCFDISPKGSGTKIVLTHEGVLTDNGVNNKATITLQRLAETAEVFQDVLIKRDTGSKSWLSHSSGI